MCIARFSTLLKLLYVQMQCIVHVTYVLSVYVHTYISTYVCTLLYVGDVMHLKTCAKWNESIRT